MENRIITFDSLIEYCKTNKINHFSSKETGKPIILSTFGNMSGTVNDKFTSVDNSLMPVTLKACHCGINRNNSKISEAVMAKALPSFSNKPILAEILDKDGIKDFGSHAMEYVEDSKGNFFVRYIERAVGIVPESCNARLEYDNKYDRMYTIVDGYIFNYYGNETAEIIKRKNGTKVSVELEVNEFTWSDEDECLEILDFVFSGITLLGEDVMEGMEASRLDLAKLPEVEMNYSAQLVEMQEKLDKLIDCFNNKSNHNGKEEIQVVEEIIKDEVNETVGMEATEEVVEETVEMSEESTEEVVEEVSEATEETPDEVEETVEESADEAVEETVAEEEPSEYELLKAEYEEYKANHSHTNEEYEALSQFKADIESAQLHAQREEILADDKYSVLSENEAFAELKKNMDNYSLVDLEKEAKVIFADHVALVGNFSVNTEDKKTTSVKLFANVNKNVKRSRYGNLFPAKN